MKDIYELLNDIEVDDKEMKEIEVSEIEKERIKKTLRKKIKKQSVLKKAVIAAGLSSVFVLGAVSFSMNNPVYAESIPVIGDIFTFINRENSKLYSGYRENANEINVTKEDKGISITIKDAIFDGRTFTYTYEIKSSKDLGDNITLSSGPRMIKDYRGGLAGSSGVKKVSDCTYVGQDAYTINEKRDSIDFLIDIDKIIDEDDSSIITGNWKFNINLDAIEGKTTEINKGIEKDGIKVNIDKITETPISCIVEYSYKVSDDIKNKFFNSHVGLDAKDNLGNVYESEDDGAYGNTNDQIYHATITFEKINSDATKLILTPKADLSNTGGGVSGDENGVTKDLTPVIDENHPEREEFTMDDIVIELK